MFKCIFNKNQFLNILVNFIRVDFEKKIIYINDIDVTLNGENNKVNIITNFITKKFVLIYLKPQKNYCLVTGCH